MKKRKAVDSEQILSHIVEQKKSGQSALAYCRQHRICKSSFYRWRKIYGTDHKFNNQDRFIELPPMQSARQAIVEIDLSSGSKVRFYPGANAKLISLIIGSL